jgi:hypothetical protein
MVKTCLTITLTLLFAVSVIAQTSKKSTTKRGSTKKTTRTIEKATLSDLYDKDSEAYCLELPQPIIGTIVSRKFDDEELTLIGFTIREKTDERTFVNIDTEYVSGKGRFVPTELSSILSKGKRVKIRVYGCGAAGALFYLDKVQEL